MLIHTESRYFAGAQKMLGYFLDELSRHRTYRLVIAMVENAKVRELLPESIEVCVLPSNQQFSFGGLFRQLQQLRTWCRKNPVDVVHGWTARDWELTALLALSRRCGALGTLHDHPQADFLSRSRQRLMKWSARGLNSVVCVSHAVRKACQTSGYPESKLTVVPNGLPAYSRRIGIKNRSVFRFGFLGVFSERKGLRTLFEIAAELGGKSLPEWELWIGGGVQDESGQNLMQELRAQYQGMPWWHRVRWVGWVKQPGEFLEAIDLLIVPSEQFDPFPTVLLEAGFIGIPALAADVGGVREIIDHNFNGWLFKPGDSKSAARCLAELLRDPSQVSRAGTNGLKKATVDFSVAKMVENYSRLYLHLKSDVQR